MAFKKEAELKAVEDLSASQDVDYSDLLKKLSEPFSKEQIKQRVGWTDRNGKDHLVNYVEWHSVVRRLNEISPTWELKVVSSTQEKDCVVVVGELKIEGITRSGIGTCRGSDEKAWKGAASDLIKRLAVLFGVAIELYESDEDVTADSSERKSNNPATANQLKYIQDLCDKNDKDINKLSARLFSKHSSKLLFDEAKKLIDELKGNTHATEAAKPIVQAKAAPEGVSIDDEEPNGEEGDWRAVVMHFGRHKGEKLGDLPKDWLKWAIESWQPKEFKGKFNDTDLKLRRALDSIEDADLD